jgi:hypothetical protein
MIVVQLETNVPFTANQRRLVALPNRLRNLQIVARKDIIPAMNKMLRRHWDSKGSAFGHKWAAWALSTYKRRLRRGNIDKGLLRDTDNLSKALFRERANDQRVTVLSDGVEITFNTRVPYAVFHQVGTQFMPERQIFPDPAPETFKREVRAILRARILEVASA